MIDAPVALPAMIRLTCLKIVRSRLTPIKARLADSGNPRRLEKPSNEEIQPCRAG
jgi:hypothetical protein